MKSIQVILLLFFAGTAFASTLRNQAVLSLGRDGCKDDSGSTTLTDPISQLIWWCFNGAGCSNSRMDYVFITVKSANFIKKCRPESQGNDLYSKQVRVLKAPALMSERNVAKEAKEAINEATSRISNYQSAFRDGNCYCYAGSWDKDRDVKVYATVVTHKGDTVTIEMGSNYYSLVDSEWVRAGVYFKILQDTCTDGNWKTNVCSHKYIVPKKSMSWSDFADEIAWLGDRNKNPGGVEFREWEP